MIFVYIIFCPARNRGGGCGGQWPKFGLRH